jgi:hypothetical protein
VRAPALARVRERCASQAASSGLQRALEKVTKELAEAQKASEVLVHKLEATVEQQRKACRSCMPHICVVTVAINGLNTSLWPPAHHIAPPLARGRVMRR